MFRNFFSKSIVNNITLGLRHASMWAFSKTESYYNPKFKAPDAASSIHKGIAIYCVHGTADRPASFSLVGSRLLQALPEEVSKIHLVGFNGRASGESITYFAKQLLDQILANGDDHVILMGHSRGGLVVAYLAEYFAREANITVDIVFTVSSPLKGASAAIWPLSRASLSVSEMQVNSDFVNELSQKMDNSTIQYVHFSSTKDLLVSIDSAFRGQQNYVQVLYDEGGEVNVRQPSQVAQPSNIHHLPKLILLDFHDHLSIMSSHRMVKYMNQEIHSVVNKLTATEKNKTLFFSSLLKKS